MKNFIVKYCAKLWISLLGFQSLWNAVHEIISLLYPQIFFMFLRLTSKNFQLFVASQLTHLISYHGEKYMRIFHFRLLVSMMIHSIFLPLLFLFKNKVFFMIKLISIFWISMPNIFSIGSGPWPAAVSFLIDLRLIQMIKCRKKFFQLNILLVKKYHICFLL